MGQVETVSVGPISQCHVKALVCYLSDKDNIKLNCSERHVPSNFE